MGGAGRSPDDRDAFALTEAGSKAIEVLRVAAMLMLVGLHVGLIGLPTRLGEHVSYLLHMGWLGTDLLLATAGFFCARSLRKPAAGARRAQHLGAYLRRRALRVLPAYFAFLVLYLYALPALAQALGAFDALPHGLRNPGPARGRAEPMLWTLTANFALALQIRTGAALEGLFAICVGAQATLLVTATLGFMPRHRHARALLGLWAMTALVRVAAVALGWTEGRGYFVYAFPLTRCEPFVLGALVCVWLDHPVTRLRLTRHAGRLCLAAFACTLCLAYVTRMLSVYHPLVNLVGFPLVSLGAAAAVAWLVQRERLPRALHPTAALGATAYGVYFVKLPFVSALSERLQASDLPEAAQALIGSLGALLAIGLLGAAFHYLVERPLTRPLGAWPRHLQTRGDGRRG